MNRLNIKDLSVGELPSLIAPLDDRRHRTAQILKWLYQKGVSRFDEMTNLPLSLREQLARRFVITRLECADSVSSEEDNSQKFLLATDDGNLIEAVLMDMGDHQTICISSQVGCSLGCHFCRTGEGGLERNLRCDEILNQVLFFKAGHLKPRRRFNIVYMGMGEPLLNLDNVSRSLKTLNHMEAFALGEKRITLSTIGLPGPIAKLAETDLKFGLAISLNATTDKTRKSIMPKAAAIRETLIAAEQFACRRNVRVTLEYVLIAGINDSPEDARRLSRLTAGRPFKINLIPLNEWDGSDLRRPEETVIDRFIELLLPKAPAVTVRRSLGTDISAACGQLRVRKIEESR